METPSIKLSISIDRTRCRVYLARVCMRSNRMSRRVYPHPRAIGERLQFTKICVLAVEHPPARG
jgi:hypothetical protein